MIDRPLRFVLCLVCVIVAGLAAVSRPVQAQDDSAALLARINALRVQSGLLPFAVSSQLTTSATRLAADRKSTRLNSSHSRASRMPSSA